MTPLGHAAISVLLARRFGYRGRALALCLAGAVLPDLVDKPLVAAGVVEVVHTVGHSVVVLCAAALAVGLAGRSRWWPLVAGWAGHVAADLVVAYPKFLVNYAWPVLPPRPTPDDPVLAYWVEYAVGPLGALEIALAVAAVLAATAGPDPLLRTGHGREP